MSEAKTEIVGRVRRPTVRGEMVVKARRVVESLSVRMVGRRDDRRPTMFSDHYVQYTLVDDLAEPSRRASTRFQIGDDPGWPVNSPVDTSMEGVQSRIEDHEG